MGNDNDRRVIIITGPTCSGKTVLSLEYVSKFNGEIVNCDSLQVYDELKILTAYPTEDEYSAVLHHLFGFLKNHEKINAYTWSTLAAQKITEIFQRNRVPIIVGGTGLFISTLTEGVSPLPVVSQETRSLANALAKEDYDELCRRVYEGDPNIQKVIPKEKHRQMIRAFEIYTETKKSILYFYGLPRIKFLDAQYETNIIALERSVLYERINRRVENMMKLGAIDEVQDLLLRIGHNNLPRQIIFNKFPIFQALGAKEIVSYIDGEINCPDLIEAIQTTTRHYAKRQLTWFKTKMQSEFES
ncbi:MAG: tRNA (adenosine(37)-N6)-dimethylallyltransferase MiaA [Holosporales bacterium]|jgi:tRNA dimethylallyltransferase|nr:tRNA (adenosine(37)-N6)-dimethylallyltransferase MiaA [Holosporales bacterium]